MGMGLCPTRKARVGAPLLIDTEVSFKKLFDYISTYQERSLA